MTEQCSATRNEGILVSLIPGDMMNLIKVSYGENLAKREVKPGWQSSYRREDAEEEEPGDGELQDKAQSVKTIPFYNY